MQVIFTLGPGTYYEFFIFIWQGKLILRRSSCFIKLYFQRFLDLVRFPMRSLHLTMVWFERSYQTCIHDILIALNLPKICELFWQTPRESSHVMFMYYNNSKYMSMIDNEFQFDRKHTLDIYGLMHNNWTSISVNSKTF